MGYALARVDARLSALAQGPAPEELYDGRPLTAILRDGTRIVGRRGVLYAQRGVLQLEGATVEHRGEAPAFGEEERFPSLEVLLELLAGVARLEG